MRASEEARAHAAALAGLPGMTPVRLAKLLDGFHPALAWQAVRAGAHPADPGRRFTPAVRTAKIDEIWAGYQRHDVLVLLPGEEGYPSMLLGDPGAPAVLFALGEPVVVEAAPRVAIVGTRSATPYGRQVASELASDLAAAGVIVVSGLALGIDGAAHAGVARGQGSRSAPPVAVVGTGLDTVYPPQNRELWDVVARRGAVFSEASLGTKPHPRVFPARNRIIAALSDVVVIVESHRGGGSLYTAEAAARRSIPVCAVPGSVKSRASEGTNGLLVDGCTPVRDVQDVLVALSLARAAKYEGRTELLALQKELDLGRIDREDSGGPVSPTTSRSATQHGSGSASSESRESSAGSTDGDGMRLSEKLTPDERAVWDAIDEEPTPFETILTRANLTVAEAATACDHLVECGALLAGAGWWSKDLGSSRPGEMALDRRPPDRGRSLQRAKAGDAQAAGKVFSCHPIEVLETGPAEGSEESAGAVQLG